MSGKLPVDTVLAFLEQINSGNVDGLCALMTKTTCLLTGLGTACKAVRPCARAGPDTFACFLIDVVAAFGSAEGTLAVKGA